MLRFFKTMITLQNANINKSQSPNSNKHNMKGLNRKKMIKKKRKIKDKKQVTE